MAKLTENRFSCETIVPKVSVISHVGAALRAILVANKK